MNRIYCIVFQCTYRSDAIRKIAHRIYTKPKKKYILIITCLWPRLGIKSKLNCLHKRDTIA